MSAISTENKQQPRQNTTIDPWIILSYDSFEWDLTVSFRVRPYLGDEVDRARFRGQPLARTLRLFSRPYS